MASMTYTGLYGRYDMACITYMTCRVYIYGLYNLYDLYAWPI